jgi:hypothetical protein
MKSWDRNTMDRLTGPTWVNPFLINRCITHAFDLQRNFHNARPADVARRVGRIYTMRRDRDRHNCGASGSDTSSSNRCHSGRARQRA